MAERRQTRQGLNREGYRGETIQADRLLYELNDDNHASPAETVIREVARICPIDRSSRIDGREARNGIIRPRVDSKLGPDWPEAFYLLQRGVRYSVTLEAPSDFPLGQRIAALAMATNVVLRWPAFGSRVA